jgi:hypothetical protein
MYGIICLHANGISSLVVERVLIPLARKQIILALYLYVHLSPEDETSGWTHVEDTVKAIPLQGLTGPEGSRRLNADSYIPCRSHAVLLRLYIVYFPFDLHGAAVFDSHMPCRSPAMPRICLSEATSQGHGRFMARSW